MLDLGEAWVLPGMRFSWNTACFIEKARQVHEDYYSYQNTVYTGSHTKVTVHCKKHGDFSVLPLQHLKRRVGCRHCAHEKQSSNLATFIEKARAQHGDSYDYSRVQYRNAYTPVEIVCDLHGSFFQAPNNHTRGRKCPNCSKESNKGRFKAWSQETFIQRAKEIHGDAYTYDLVEYRGKRTKVTITCIQHGDFPVWPGHFLKSQGCPACFRETKRLPREKFLARVASIHGAKYTVPESSTYTGNQNKISVECSEHGEIYVRPGVLMRGGGCRRCADEALALKRKMSYDEFVEKARSIHGDKYSYSRVDYVNSGRHVILDCSVHGEFSQTPESHIYRKAGCPSCVHQHSVPHKEIEAYLDTLGVSYQSNVRYIIPPKELDIWLPDHQVGIEFNGSWWHSTDSLEHNATFKRRHLDKFLMCKKLGISLLQIDEHAWNDPIVREIWTSVIASKLGKQRKIFARATMFSKIEKQDARQFLYLNHLQQECPSFRWCYGLKYEGELVGVITFKGHEKTSLNLSRLAFARGLTVVGGAQKLFKNSLPLLPNLPIVTFSNNQYSAGNIYRTLGFHWDANLSPSYQWLYKSRVLNKRQCRHKHLPKILGNSYDPTLNEHDNMFRAGARCLYDAGYQRWVYSSVRA